VLTAHRPSRRAAGPSDVTHACFQRDAGGSRTHWKAALQAAAVPSGSSVTSVLARNRTWTSTFAGLHAHPAHPEDVFVLAARRGVEPGDRPAGCRLVVQFRGLPCDPAHSQAAFKYPDLDLNQDLDLRRVQCKSATPSGHEHEREESNPVEQFWRLLALPGAHSCNAALGAKSSQGIRRELNPYLLVHSQACSDRYTTDTMSTSSSTRI
jgi:hypothetical protein